MAYRKIFEIDNVINFTNVGKKIGARYFTTKSDGECGVYLDSFKIEGFTVDEYF